MSEEKKAAKTKAPKAAKNVKTAKAPKAAKARAPKAGTAESQNGVALPREGSASAAVWGIADKLSQAAKSPAARKAVLDASEKAGVNAATAATQYARWRTYHGVQGRLAA